MLDPIASGLIERWLAGECDRREVAEIEAWLVADPTGKRRAEVDRLREAWEEAARASADTVEPLSPADIRAAWHAVAGRVRAGSRVRPLVLPNAITEDRRRTWPLRAAMAVGVAALLVVAVALPRIHALARVYTTARAEQATITLSDGTRVTLAPDSRLTMPALLADGARELALSGEAIFDVRHDPLRPFRVRTAHGVTTNVGTLFAVRDYAGDTVSRVAVRNGVVLVSVSDTLRAGDVAVIASAARAVVSHPDGIPSELAWGDGRLVFRAAPLGNVLGTLARWYDLDVRIGSAHLAERSVTTTVSAREPLDDLLHELSIALGVACARQGRVVTVSEANNP